MVTKRQVAMKRRYVCDEALVLGALLLLVLEMFDMAADFFFFFVSLSFKLLLLLWMGSVDEDPPDCGGE